MKIQTLCVATILATGLSIGCEEASDDATTVGEAAESATTTTGEASGDTLESLKTEAAEAGEALKEAGSEALESSKDKVDEVIEAGKDQFNELAGQLESATATSSDAAGGLTLDSLTEGMSLDSAQLDGVIDQVKGLIGEENYDTAKQWISKLEGMELPEGYADQIEGLKGLLEKAQGAGDALKGLGL